MSLELMLGRQRRWIIRAHPYFGSQCIGSDRGFEAEFRATCVRVGSACSPLRMMSPHCETPRLQRSQCSFSGKGPDR